MKKIALLALAALITVPVFAQEEAWDGLVYASPNDVVRFEVLSSVGYGYHIVNTQDFRSNASSEYFLNLMSLGLYPIDAIGFELGLDLMFNNFGSRTHAFSLNQDRKVQATDFSQFEVGTLDRHRGDFNIFSLNAPLVVKFRAGDFWIGGGAVASLNLLGSTNYYYRQDYRTVEVTERRAKLNTFTYGLVATLGYNGFGAYFKYYPRTSRLLPAGSVDMSYMTIGFVFDY